MTTMDRTADKRFVELLLRMVSPLLGWSKNSGLLAHGATSATRDARRHKAHLKTTSRIRSPSPAVPKM
jgi:hypothetical protein